VAQREQILKFLEGGIETFQYRYKITNEELMMFRRYISMIEMVPSVLYYATTPPSASPTPMGCDLHPIEKTMILIVGMDVLFPPNPTDQVRITVNDKVVHSSYCSQYNRRTRFLFDRCVICINKETIHFIYPNSLSPILYLMKLEDAK
jgi:hypothetical protein